MGAALGLGLRKTYRLLASGELTLDLARGRRSRPLGPLVWSIQAPREIVFDVIAAPISDEHRKRSPTSCRCGSGAATWCSRPITPR